MKRLFLTSSIGTPKVAESIRARLGHHKSLKTVFITTPIEVEDMTDDSWYQADRLALTKNGFDISDYTITGKTKRDLQKDLAHIDALYISGGNANHLLEESQKSGFIEFISDYIKSDKLYLSTSAGSIIAGPNIPPYLWGDQVGAPNLSDYSSYGIVNFTVLPHWGSPHFADKYLKGRIEQIYSDHNQPFVVLNDNQYVEVRDDSYVIVDVTKE